MATGIHVKLFLWIPGRYQASNMPRQSFPKDGIPGAMGSIACTL